jgi:hypothetical protein
MQIVDNSVQCIQIVEWIDKHEENITLLAGAEFRWLTKRGAMGQFFNPTPIIGTDDDSGLRHSDCSCIFILNPDATGLDRSERDRFDVRSSYDERCSPQAGKMTKSRN